MNDPIRIQFDDPDLLSRLTGIQTDVGDFFANGGPRIVPTAKERKDARALNASVTAGKVAGATASIAGAGLFIASMVQLVTGGAWLPLLALSLGTSIFGGLILGAILGGLAYAAVQLFTK